MNIKDRKENIMHIIQEANDIGLLTLNENCAEELAKHIIKSEAEKETEKQLKKKQIIKFLKAKDSFQEILQECFGNFYLYFYLKFPMDINKQYKFRFLYLCTFITYENNKLVYKQGQSYKFYREGDLMDLLKLSERETRNTKKILTENNLMTINKDKSIEINPKVVRFGEIKKEEKCQFTRVFKDAIQELYNKALPREHKNLGLLIDLIPLIHYKYNIICKNPECKLLEEVEPLSIKEIGTYLQAYEGKNVSKLKTKLFKLKVNMQDVIMYIERDGLKAFVVNPSAIYMGNDIESLSYLIDIFSI